MIKTLIAMGLFPFFAYRAYWTKTYCHRIRFYIEDFSQDLHCSPVAGLSLFPFGKWLVSLGVNIHIAFSEKFIDELYYKCFRCEPDCPLSIFDYKCGREVLEFLYANGYRFHQISMRSYSSFFEDCIRICYFDGVIDLQEILIKDVLDICKGYITGGLSELQRTYSPNVRFNSLDVKQSLEDFLISVDPFNREQKKQKREEYSVLDCRLRCQAHQCQRCGKRTRKRCKKMLPRVLLQGMSTKALASA